MPRISTQIRQSFSDFGDDFDTIETELEQWKGRLGSARRSVSQGEARANEQLQNNVEFLISIMASGLAIRVHRSAEAVVTLVNKNNPHAAPAVARALFETCCVPIYLQRELLPRVEKGKLEQVHQLVFRSTLGSIGVFSQDHIRPVKVNALIKSARAELNDMADALPPEEHFDAAELIDIYYGPLTEFTHPNWGALSLATTIGLPPKFDPAVGFDKTLMHSVASSAAYILSAGGRAFDTVLETLERFPMDLPNGDPVDDEPTNLTAKTENDS